jgi:hypothetical protein
VVDIEDPDVTVTVDGNDELTVQNGQQKFEIRPAGHG